MTRNVEVIESAKTDDAYNQTMTMTIPLHEGNLAIRTLELAGCPHFAAPLQGGWGHFPIQAFRPVESAKQAPTTDELAIEWIGRAAMGAP